MIKNEFPCLLWSIWLLWLEKKKAYGLFNIALSALVPCQIRGIEAEPTAMRLHPEFFMGQN